MKNLLFEKEKYVRLTDLFPIHAKIIMYVLLPKISVDVQFGSSLKL